ncbi:conjugal transfer protein TraN [Methylomonas sp. EFPC1]|uniref:conjugal transfer protein TraN n=1 Tax=Methylomonas sp. EFPC1 TaxID=2812647 RepID=UPI001F07DDEA|nr:conjugal transfer protein TraN [Methylomonas sp. EFPC1]
MDQTLNQARLEQWAETFKEDMNSQTGHVIWDIVMPSALSMAVSPGIYLLHAVGFFFTASSETQDHQISKALISTHGVDGIPSEIRVAFFDNAEALSTVRKESYCCYNSPLARILNEQIKPQLDMDFGTPETPSCTGIKVADLDRVDWTKVNLDEWLAILAQTGHLPSAANAASMLNLDQLTGTGSRLNPQKYGAASSGRQDRLPNFSPCLINKSLALFSSLSSRTALWSNISNEFPDSTCSDVEINVRIALTMTSSSRGSILKTLRSDN